MPQLFALSGSIFCSVGAWCGLNCQGMGPFSVSKGAGDLGQVVPLLVFPWLKQS